MRTFVFSFALIWLCIPAKADVKFTHENNWRIGGSTGR